MVCTGKGKGKEKNKNHKRSLHYYTDSSIQFKIGDTADEKPNIGIFNVWSTDNRRCYEFAGNNSIEEIKKGNKIVYKARHGWTKYNKPTIEFELEKTYSPITPAPPSFWSRIKKHLQ